jgi:hypothetical protein
LSFERRCVVTETVADFVERYRAIGLEGTPATPQEVEALGPQLGAVLPAAYQAFLLILGRDGGPDFVGSDCTVRHVPALQCGAVELLKRKGSPASLPEKAVVFLMHQGYSFFYFVADGKTADPPVFRYCEGEPAPSCIAASFSAWLRL